MLMKMPLTANNMELNIGTTDIKVAEGVISEPMIGAVPHSVTLLRLADDEDINSAVKKIKDNVNGWKWICVGVDNVIVDNVGRLVIVIMDKDYDEALHKSFLKLAK